PAPPNAPGAPAIPAPGAPGLVIAPGPMSPDGAWGEGKGPERSAGVLSGSGGRVARSTFSWVIAGYSGDGVCDHTGLAIHSPRAAAATPRIASNLLFMGDSPPVSIRWAIRPWPDIRHRLRRGFPILLETHVNVISMGISAGAVI